MAYKKPKYDAACYYGGKLLGRCTAADGNAYETLMKSCGGDAARVLREYSYFSPELKAILEKAAAQAGRSRERPSPGGPFAPPKNSPWGEVDYCDALCPGVFLVSAASHGGAMVAKDMANVLSPAARKCGLRQNGFLCFEEDCDEAIVLRELLDKKLWDIPDRIKDRAAFEESIDRSLKEYHPDYWRSREHGREAAALAAPAKAAAREAGR
jgi:hypothetical protein